MILLIDNYDSFVFNLARYFERLGQATHVVRNDAIDVKGIRRLAPEAIVLSPGPCTPQEAGCSVDVVRQLASSTPMLGVCLGHQAIGAALGGRVLRAREPMHGRTSLVYHCERSVFAGLPNPFTACRYHSLVVDRATMPECLEITAWTDDDTVMAVAHREWPLVGLQFHPESILTDPGYPLLAAFLRLAGITICGEVPLIASERVEPRPVAARPWVRLPSEASGANPTLIVEGIVTTRNEDRSVNISPMGPDFDEAAGELVLKPYQTSTTYRNLKRSGQGVFHVTDDVELIAHAAVGIPDPLPPLEEAPAVDGIILSGACRWFALRVRTLDDREPRTRIVCDVVERGRLRDFVGFNRGKHAVLEAAILATRTDFLPFDEILAEFARLLIPVRKTGGAAEQRAFQFLQDYVHSRLQAKLTGL